MGQIVAESSFARAAELVETFKQRTAGLPYESKGVLYSEMLMVFAAVGEGFTGQILESGRARGQSTHCLSVLFPEAKVVSVEFARDHEDAPVAEARLGPLDNVQLEYGDSRELLPRLLEPESVVVIDGPKGFRAMRLALNLLKTGKPRCVFLHDMSHGSPTRGFAEKHIPHTFFSDDPEFVDAFKHLDTDCWDDPGRDGQGRWLPYQFEGQKQESYGPTFAALPRVEAVSYGRLALQLGLANSLTRLGRSIRKRTGG